MFLLVGLAAPAGAQEAVEVPGEVVVVPLATPSPIVLDGDLGDWATLGAIVTNDGPVPSADPANSGQLRWQVAADASTFYFAATITDDNIVAGRNGDDYWNEDSIELYLDVSGDDTLRTYGDGVAQITFSAVDRGNTDPQQLSLSGNGEPDFTVSGFVFATTAGWGVEMAIDLTDKVVPANGESPESSRSLLYAAAFSAVSILIGGLWFERRRKKSEAASAAAVGVDEEENVDDLIASILDENET